MTAKQPDSRKVTDTDSREGRGFAVTRREEIGYVEFDDLFGNFNSAQAAFHIIASDARDGVYEFPGPDENTTTRVVVDWTVPDGA